MCGGCAEGVRRGRRGEGADLLCQVDEARGVLGEALAWEVVAADFGVGRGAEAAERRLDRLGVVGAGAGAALGCELL